MAIFDGKIRCSGCGEPRPLLAFPPSAVNRGNGKCRTCLTEIAAVLRATPEGRARANAYSRNYYLKNKAKHLARTKRYYYASRERWTNRHLQRAYGISLDQYEALLDAQRGGCALCGKPQSAEKLRLAVDHDHATGAVRGLLCHHCNRAIGALGDNVAGLRRALDLSRAGAEAADARRAGDSHQPAAGSKLIWPINEEQG